MGWRSLVVAGCVAGGLLVVGPARADGFDYRVGAHYSGHLLFRDVVAAEGQWILRDEERAWLSDLNVQSGIGSSVTTAYLTVPLLFRAELFHYRVVGFELTGGMDLSFYRGTFGATGTACAGIPVQVKRLRVQSEACMNLSAGRPLWGVGVFYEL